MKRVSKAASNANILFNHYINKYITTTQQEISGVESQIDAGEYQEEVEKARRLLSAVLEGLNFEAFMPKLAYDNICTGEHFRISKNQQGNFMLYTNNGERLVKEEEMEGAQEFRVSMGYFDFISKSGAEIRFKNENIRYTFTMYGFDNVKGNIVSLRYKNEAHDIDLDVFCQFDSGTSILMTYVLDNKIVKQDRYALTTRDLLMIEDTRLNHEFSI